MSLRTILTLATLFVASFAMAVLAQSLPRSVALASAGGAVGNQSVSGKIASVGDAAFELSIPKSDEKDKTVQFLVDDQTKVEGKLTVGAQATVEYRSESGRNIAVHVVVTPSSGLKQF